MREKNFLEMVKSAGKNQGSAKSRPAAQRPASQFTSHGPVLNFGQRYFTAHVLICVQKWKKVSFDFFAVSIVSMPWATGLRTCF